MRIVFLRLEPDAISCYQLNYADRKQPCTDAFDSQTLAGRGEILSGGGADREEKLQMLVDQKLRDIQNARLKVSVGKKEVIVNEQVRKVVYAILSVKDFIGSAVSAEPHAALAWAGVLVILPVSSYI